MATTTATRANANFPVSSHGGGICNVAYGSNEPSSTPSSGDFIEMHRVPNGAVVLHGWLYADDLDGGTEALELFVGDGDDVDRFGDMGVCTGDVVTGVRPEVGISYPYGGTLMTVGPYTYTAEDTIDVEVQVAANSWVAGPITCVTFYAVA